MDNLTVEAVKERGWLIYEVIVGSKAYGLDTAQSDTDIKGVFVLPKQQFYGLNYVPQVNNATNDVVYYELGRFVELLSKSNPNILEMLYVPTDCVLYRHERMDLIRPELFLSKLCEETFANYAYTQIKKAYGLEKKIMRTMERERKSLLAFCYTYTDGMTLPLLDFLEQNNLRQEEVGLAAINHLRKCYNMYYATGQSYRGIISQPDANDLCTSSIPKGEKPVALLYCNKEGYSAYCKEYKSYWDWVKLRNEERYKGTLAHGKKYDAKNMMHVFRLLQMAKEIAEEGTLHVRRPDREWLLSIKQGKFEYDELVEDAEKRREALPLLYAHCNLPEQPDMATVNELLSQLRTFFYKS
jgi:uncharacterized protein